MRISDWSSDVCSSDLRVNAESSDPAGNGADWNRQDTIAYIRANYTELAQESGRTGGNDTINAGGGNDVVLGQEGNDTINAGTGDDLIAGGSGRDVMTGGAGRSEEHTSELQSIMRISYAVSCLKKQNTKEHLQHEPYQ